MSEMNTISGLTGHFDIHNGFRLLKTIDLSDRYDSSRGSINTNYEGSGPEGGLQKRMESFVQDELLIISDFARYIMAATGFQRSNYQFEMHIMECASCKSRSLAEILTDIAASPAWDSKEFHAPDCKFLKEVLDTHKCELCASQFSSGEEWMSHIVSTHASHLGNDVHCRHALIRPELCLIKTIKHGADEKQLLAEAIATRKKEKAQLAALARNADNAEELVVTCTFNPETKYMHVAVATTPQVATDRMPLYTASQIIRLVSRVMGSGLRGSYGGLALVSRMSRDDYDTLVCYAKVIKAFMT